MAEFTFLWRLSYSSKILWLRKRIELAWEMVSWMAASNSSMVPGICTHGRQILKNFWNVRRGTTSHCKAIGRTQQYTWNKTNNHCLNKILETSEKLKDLTFKLMVITILQFKQIPTERTSAWIIVGIYL